MTNSIEPVQVAEGFGKALDQDDFSSVKGLIAPDCTYTIGDTSLVGPDDIADSYEQNMLKGRKQLDELVWGDTYVEAISTNEFMIFFTDYIKHKGHSFVHRCKQKVTIGESFRISKIEHVDDENESQRLKDFFEKVGVKS